MARHVWSVLCERAIIDRDSESLSLIDVVDAVVYEAEIAPGQVVQLPAELSLVSLWIRAVGAEPEAPEARFWIKSSSGDQLVVGDPRPIPLQDSPRAHLVFEVPFVPIGPSGRYEFVVEHRDAGPRGVGPWTPVANIPLDISVESPQTPPVR